jgi:hypothetical protein
MRSSRALGIDVRHFERHHLGDPQIRRVGGAQRGLVLRAGATSSNRATSSGLSTIGILRGSRTNVRCSRSGIMTPLAAAAAHVPVLSDEMNYMEEDPPNPPTALIWVKVR